MAGYDHYDPVYDRGGRYDDRRGYDTYTRERETQHVKGYPSSASRDLVRHRDSDLSIEEVPRDFPPPGYHRRARSAEPGYDYDARYDGRSRQLRGPGSVYYQEEEERRRKPALGKQEKLLAAVAGAALGMASKEAYDRYDAKKDGHPDQVDRNLIQSAALGAAGAFAGYQGAEFYNKHGAKEEKRTKAVYHGRDGRYYEYEDEDTSKKGQKKFLESVLGVTSVGAAIKMLAGGGDDKSSRRGHSRSSSRGSTRSRGDDVRGKIQKAAMASLIAGATEAFRVSKEPGGWKGEKAKRVVTAAMGAGALGGAHSEGHNKKDILESVIGGLMGNRMIHGSKSNIEADERDPGRSRSRSRAARGRSSSRDGGGSGGNGAAAALGAILAGLGAKKALDSRDRSRSSSRSHPRRRSRSRSVVDKARNSLARLGIGNDADNSDDEHRRGSSRRRRYSDDYDERDYRGSSRRDKSRERSRSRGRGQDDYDRDHYDDRSYRSSSRRRGGRSDAGSDIDLGDSDEDRKQAKKMRGKQILTTGLAGVATIHAANEVYQSMQKRQARQKAVREGRLTEAEAKKLKTKAIIQDAASVGVAALGIKGAISEVKEAREMQQKVREFQQHKKERHEKRLARQRSVGGSSSRGPREGYSTPGTPRRGRYDYDDDGYGYDDGYYTDGNPYAATLPAPPIGYSRR